MIFILSIFASSSLIGFDIGSETIKAAAIRSGRSIEIILNEQSKRKTPSFVSFETDLPITVENIKNITRYVGFSALSVLSRNSSAVVRAIPEIIGKNSSDELQAHLDNRYYKFKMNGTLVNGVEPHLCLAMLFHQFMHNAETQLQQGVIKDAVIAVPAYFTDVQRARVSQAAKIAGLNLLKIIDEKHSLALVYALEKTSFFTREARTVAIVDIGHSSITISGYKFTAKIVTQKGRSPRPVPKIDDLGYVWDDTIGGIDFDLIIAKYLSEKYNVPITQTLIDDSQKVKHALTLNDVVNISLDSFNHKIVMKRSEFEDISGGLLSKISELAKSLNQTFDSVEFVGGASRIPIVVDTITSVLGPASRSLNGDEAIVMGAAYTAAMTSGAFKLMDVSHDPTSAHSATLTYGQKTLRLFSQGSSMTKMKTARLDAHNNETDITLQYESKIPVGCDKLIGRWTILRRPTDDPYPNVSRLAISFGFNDKTRVVLTKSQLFVKLENKQVIQSTLDVKHVYSPLQISKEEKTRQKLLLNAFTSNDIRLNKIAESRNNLESLIFELRESHQNDPVWLKVMAPNEKEAVNKTLTETIHWLENTEFEDELLLNQKTKELEDEVKNIRYRVQEGRSRDSCVSELEYMLSDMQDAVLNRWPQRKLKVPKQQKKALLNHIKLTREWLERRQQEQQELDPWDEPALKTTDVELRIKKLGDSFKALEEGVLTNKLKNARGDDDDENENEYGADL